MRRTICTLALLLLLPGAAAAAAGEVSFLEGKATRTPEKGKPLPLALKGTVEQGDVLETGANGRLEVVLGDKSVVRLGPSSRLKLDTARFEETGREFKATLLLGKVWSKVTSVFGAERNFEVRTERAVAGVRGTVFRVDADKKKSVMVKVYDGTVAVVGRPVAATTGAPPQKGGERVQVPGPQAVDKKQWEKIVGAMMQVKVSAAGEVSEPTQFSEADEAKDAWAAWNRERDSALQ